MLLNKNNAYVSYGMGKMFIHEIIDIDSLILSKIKSDIEQIELLLKDSKYSPQLYANVLSLYSYIEIIDPLGEDYSESLSSKWHDAQWVGHDHPQNIDERLQQIFQYLAVAKGLLLSGKAKIVKYKEPLDNIDNLKNKLGMWVNPNPYLLHRREFDVKPKQIFLIQAYALHNSIYPVIKKMLHNSGYELMYYTERNGQVIFDDIWNLMNESQAILVDFTHRRPNVYLEYGMALVLGKPIIAITQNWLFAV